MSFQRDDYATIQAEADAWWTRLRSGNATHADAQAFRRWCDQSPEHARAWRDLNTLLDTLDPAARQAVRRNPSLAQMPESRRRTDWLAVHPGRRAFLGGALAASVAGVAAVRPPLGLWPSVLEFTADYRTGTGEQRQLALSDLLTVQMNTQTRINVHAGAGADIELVAGEAEILATASTAKPVTVIAGRGRLLASHARFNVRYTGPEVCVTCLDGQLEVGLAQRYPVAAGQQLTYDAQGLHTSLAAVDPQRVSAWRAGSLVFVDTPLSEVVEEINRYRTGKIILRGAGLGRREVRMRLALSNMDNVVWMIRDLAGAKVTELPGGIAILS